MEFKYKKSTVHRFYELEIKEIHKVLKAIGMPEDDALNLIQKNLGIPDSFMNDVKTFLNRFRIETPIDDYIRYYLAAENPPHSIAKLTHVSSPKVLRVRRDIQSHESQTYLHNLFNSDIHIGDEIIKLAKPLNLFQGHYLKDSRYFLLKHHR